MFILNEEEDVYEVAGYNGTDAKVIIPEIYRGKETVIKSGYATQGWGVFSFSAIEEVFVGAKKIGYGAFASNLSLKKVEINSTSIGDSAFSGCSGLESVIVGDRVTHIGEGVFSFCGGLESVVIGTGVTQISDSAFLNCPNLMGIEVAKNNFSYKSINGNLYSKDGKILIQYAAGKTETNFIIPDIVETIADSAFRMCKLNRVEISDSVNKIEDCAFWGCTNLESVVIPESVTSVGHDIFQLSNEDLIIYCEAENKPDGWKEGWNMSHFTVVWGYKG